MFGCLEAALAEPGLGLELGLAALAYLWGVVCALGVAVSASPPVMLSLAG